MHLWIKLEFSRNDLKLSLGEKKCLFFSLSLSLAKFFDEAEREKISRNYIPINFRHKLQATTEKKKQNTHK